jgi:NAD+ diphosphatase
MAEYFLPSAMFRSPEPEETGIIVASGSGKAAILPESIPPEDALYIGELSGRNCFAVSLHAAGSDIEVSPMRELLCSLPLPQRQALCRAATVCHWSGQHRYCGVCGRELETSTSDESLLCPECAAVYFPQIAPAVIVAVEREGKILLAKNARNRNGMFGLVAGFVGAGESLEDAVKRELAEEVGIKVENITYEGSQPWPFPNSLMVGFSARWQSGTVTPDGQEIVEAGFFAPSEFPLIPGHGSIARKLIDKFVMANNGNTLNTEK